MNFSSIDDNNTKHVYSKSSAFEKKYLNRAAMYYLTLTSPWKLQKNDKIRNKIELGCYELWNKIREKESQMEKKKIQIILQFHQKHQTLIRIMK